MRFKILKNGIQFRDLKKCCELVIALCAIHNFILKNSCDDPIFTMRPRKNWHRNNSSSSSSSESSDDDIDNNNISKSSKILRKYSEYFDDDE